MEKGHEAPSRISWPPLLFAVSLVIGIGGHYIWSVPLGPRWPTWTGGCLLVMVALLTTLRAHHALSKARTTIRPDRPATTLVTDGPFALSRNPLYLALCLLSLGVALIVNGMAPLITTVLLWTALNLIVIPREERHLAGRFPEAYATYRARVRRWL